MTRIAIADDQVLFRDMLRMLLAQEPAFEVVGAAGNGAELLRICQETAPEVVLLDVRMPDSDGLDALVQLKKTFPGIRVIMLTTFEEETEIRRACLSGADGFLLKDARPEALILAVKCVMEGLMVMHPSVRAITNRNLEKGADSVPVPVPDGIAALDAVDLAILKRISQGSNNAEIALAINYSEGTVKNRISRMLDLTSLKDRTQLAIFALQNGLI